LLGLPKGRRDKLKAGVKLGERPRVKLVPLVQAAGNWLMFAADFPKPGQESQKGSFSRRRGPLSAGGSPAPKRQGAEVARHGQPRFSVWLDPPFPRRSAA